MNISDTLLAEQPNNFRYSYGRFCTDDNFTVQLIYRENLTYTAILILYITKRILDRIKDKTLGRYQKKDTTNTSFKL
jgi:hypothetical protein